MFAILPNDSNGEVYNCRTNGKITFYDAIT